MQHAGTLVILVSLLSLPITGIMYMRALTNLCEALRVRHPALWERLGRPGITAFAPFQAGSAVNLLGWKQTWIEDLPDLTPLHRRARRMLWAYGLGFAGVLAGGALMVARDVL